MGRIAVRYTQEELTRKANYVIAICDPSIDTTIIDLEEASNYVEKWNRRAIIISDKSALRDEQIEITKYNFIMNAVKPTVRLIDKNGDSYKKVYDFLLDKFINGLVICYPETLTNLIADEISQIENRGLDFIMYRQNLMEISTIEKNRANFLRIHYNPEFIFSKENFEMYVSKFNDRNAIGIFVTQYIVNYQYGLCKSYVANTINELESVGDDDYVDYQELNRQFAYHLYYSLDHSKIMGISGDKIGDYLENMFETLDIKPLKNKAHEFAKFYV